MCAQSLLVGWREWACLPLLGVPLIKIKIDTGAYTSALHAYDINVTEEENGQKIAEFSIHPIQGNDEIMVKARAPVVDMRSIKSSNGVKQVRLVVKSFIRIGNYQVETEITLTNRDIMKHRMLLGRRAMKSILVNPSQSYCCGKISNSKLLECYYS